MRRVHPDIAYRNDIDLPLFAWARRQAAGPAETAAPRPCWRVRAIARQTGFSPSRARLVAELAGLALEDAS